MSKNDLHILMLEDDSMDAELNKAQLLLLEEYNCIVEWVTDKVSYIAAIQNSNPDIILSDYNLPGYNGLEALKDLRERKRLIPFIFVTGTIDEETAADTIKSGAWDYVVKDRLFRLPLAIRGALQLREEKAFKASALEQNLKLSKALEQSPVHIVINDIEGKIEYVNARFTEVTGYTPDDVIGKNIANVFPESILSPNAEEDWKAIREGSIWRGETQSHKKDGTTFWESISVSPIKNEDNEITHFIAVKEDITARKLMEHALIEARDRAEKSDKLKDAFLQNLSHEIRTPLNAIVGFSELLKLPDSKASETIDEYTGIILDNSYQLLSIVSDILTVARIQTGQEEVIYTPVNVSELMDKLYTVFEIKARERHLALRLTPGTQPQYTVTVTDETKLTQIITNLLNNAIKFTHEGFVEMGYTFKNNEINFFVKDTGIGIAKESCEIIFERFRQANATTVYNYGGTGLGLSISKSYAQMLGGKIWVESDQGKGSTFFLTIPFYPDEVKPSADKQANSIAIDKELTVLIAEDEFYNYLLIKSILSMPNITLIHAQNGYEAVELCRKRDDFDLVLMDIKMPVMDGLTAFQEIRQIRPGLPIIAQTAYALEQEKQQFIEKGFDDYIAKPIRKDELMDKINKAIMEHA
ncbi:MAG TPA: response regulator [Bacteroidales bacterium]|nr:response regulator [Bacteroidales bacterium]